MVEADYTNNEHYKSVHNMIRGFAECGKFEHTFNVENVDAQLYNALTASLRRDRWKVYWFSTSTAIYAGNGYGGQPRFTNVVTFAYKPPV